MAHPTTQKLLSQLEPMHHQDRMRHMIEFGKNPDLNILSTLEEGNVFERQLALVTCFSSLDSARVLRGLQDASGFIRAVALKLAAFVLSESELLEALRVLPRKMRLVLLHKLRISKANAVVDLLLEEFVTAGNLRDATEICAFASNAMIQKHLAIMQLASSADWARLARTQPTLVANWLERQALAQVETNPRLIWQVNAAIPRIAAFSASRALQLLKAVRHTTALTQLQLQGLVKRCPRELAELQLESQDPSNLEFSNVAHRLELRQLLALQIQHPRTLDNLEVQFPRLSLEARVPVFQAFRSTWADHEGLISASTLRYLPRVERELEAQHHLEHTVLSTRALPRFAYAGLLGWDQAKPLLEASIKHPKPEYRIAAIPALIFAARFDTSKYDQVLEFVQFRKNEQDPVRLVMLNAIADLPPAAWQTEHLEDLGQILQDALNAADLSYNTAHAAERIVVRLLPFHMDWAADWIGILVKQRGQINLYNIGQQISDRQAKVIASPLTPVLKTWRTQERESQIMSVLTAFGKRIRGIPEFLELAQSLVNAAKHASTSQYALALIAKHDTKRFNQIVPKLLTIDPSWITVPVVYDYLHRFRQDLLSPFLGHKVHRGRFLTGKTRFVPPFTMGFQRWNPQQQIRFVNTLDQVARDENRDIPAILFVLHQLANIPNASAATIERLADISNSRLAIRDAALRALGRLDETRGLKPLLSALEDDRARVAIYALRRLFLSMPPVKALYLLKNVSLERVTVAKEVVRLIGEVRTEAAHASLLEFSTQALHRDVRVALLRAFWDYLEYPQTWEVLQAAARDEDPAISDGVIRIPTDRLSGISQQKLVSLLSNLIEHPDPKVRLEVMRRCEWLPVTDTQKQLVRPLLAAINSSSADQIDAAARAFFATYSGSETEIIRQTFLSLLPKRRALQLATRAFLVFNRWRNMKKAAIAILTALETDVFTLHLQTEIAIQSLPWEQSAAFLITLATRQQLHADVYQTALKSLKTASEQRAEPTLGLQILEEGWGEHENELIRRLALEVLILSASNPYRNNAGWTNEQLELLDQYRRDPSHLVAAAAQFTFPTSELE
jgi:hypothetical protein